jgi:two-component sensor histidine kinase
VQGLDRVYRDIDDVRERLVQTARATAGDEQNMLASAEQILRALANQPEVRAADAGCTEALSSALQGLSFFVNITRVNAQGRMACSALPSDQPQDVRTTPWWTEGLRQTSFFVTRPMRDPVTGTNVVTGVLPVRDLAGRFDGLLTIGLDVQWLDFMLRVKQLPQGAVAAIFDGSGALLAANNQEAALRVFSDRVSLADPDRLFSTRTRDGGKWSYALAPLLGSTAFIGFAMRDADLFQSTYVHVATDLLLPVLMLGLAWAAIWIATDRLVIRWLAYLRRFTAAYAKGHYTVRPQLQDAPNEFRELGETLSSMAEAVQERDRSLRDVVAQKTMLIRETHHRVKNNLQIVMSLLSLQAGQLRDPAAQNALRQAQVRVNALALVHRILHELEDQDSVDLKRLITDLAAQIQEGFGAERRELRIELNLVSRRVSGDAAVPLTLFTVEALTNAFKHAFPPNARGGVIRVVLQPAGNGELRLAIEDSGSGPTPKDEKPGGIGGRLIRAFAQQVNGRVEITESEGGGTRVTLLFPDPGPKGNAAQNPHCDAGETPPPRADAAA